MTSKLKKPWTTNAALPEEILRLIHQLMIELPVGPAITSGVEIKSLQLFHECLLSAFVTVATACLKHAESSKEPA